LISNAAEKKDQDELKQRFLEILPQVNKKKTNINKTNMNET